jgi:hypothetical protein
MQRQLQPLVLLLASALAACGGGGSGSTTPTGPFDVSIPPGSTLTLSQVNALLAGGGSPLPGYQMTCSGSAIAGCYVIPTCYSSSQTFSTRMAYGIDADKLTAVFINYQTYNCTGPATVAGLLYGQWNYTLPSFDTVSGRGQVAATLIHYTDGYVVDPTPPQFLVTYASNISLTGSAGAKKLCLSTGLVDPTRPLRFTSTTAQGLDATNCAVTLN